MLRTLLRRLRTAVLTIAAALPVSRLALPLGLVLLPLTATAQQPRLPIFDVHIHYAHNAFDSVPAPQLIAMMRKAAEIFRTARLYVSVTKTSPLPFTATP